MAKEGIYKRIKGLLMEKNDQFWKVSQRWEKNETKDKKTSKK